MIAIALSLTALVAFGYFLVGPANRGYSPRAWAFVTTFLRFMYLFIIVISLVLGGFISGSPAVQLGSLINTLLYAAGAALATGIGAGLRGYVDARREP